jgi:Leucine-rich repeat (LRR) protein
LHRCDAQDIPETEVAALSDLYQSTNGTAWYWRGNRWNFSAPFPCTDAWQGITCSDVAAAGFLHVVELNLYDCNLVGPLPASISNLSHIQNLNLGLNHLTGAVPASLGNCTMLTSLSLSANQFTGGVPTALTQCALLEQLDISGNKLTGTIPSVYGQLQLITLAVDSNLLSGTIPPSLGNSTALVSLILNNNLLTGTIPSSLGQCANLSVLYLDHNQLSGSIPAALGQCPLLLDLHLSNNQLTGTIPESLGQCEPLGALYLSSNLLSGTIPSILEETQLSMVILADNYFSGTVPDGLLSSPFLEQFSVQYNLFTGALPVTLFGPSIPRLVQLLFDGNMLTGHIPAPSVNRLVLRQLGLSSNRLSGTLPGSLLHALRFVNFLILNNNRLTGQLPQNWTVPANTLSYLYMHENRFSGTIPESLGRATVLQNLNLSSNRLTGTIPSSFQQLISLQVLMLHNNHLKGNIAEVFSPQQTVLSAVQLSGNQLTGTLPAAVFLLPSLSSFAAVDNCFDGPLPDKAICNSVSLSALVLDGLHSAKACKRSASTTHTAFKLGTLPSCLLSMSNLATLHLSGSGLTGSLPAEANISSVLTDLSLSHNLLTGIIPESILHRDWNKVDLSYNRIKGTVEGAQGAPFSNTTELSLQHNRLSGVIPGSMQRVGTLSLLENNMFSCRVDRSDVPQQATDSDKYTCGSDAVNNALYAWLGAATMAVVVVSLAVLRYNVSPVVRNWLGAAQIAQLSALQSLFRAAEALRNAGVADAVYCIVILLPVYTAVNACHPSFTYKYAWTVSGVFLTGTTAFAVEAVFLLLQLLLCGIFTELYLRRIHLQASTPNDTVQAEQHLNKRAGTKLTNAAVMVFSLFVVTGANVAFVFATLHLTGRQLTVVQILLAVFKISFNNLAVPALQRRVSSSGQARGVSLLQIVLVLLNVIVIPCAVVMVISPACFYDALHGVNSVTSSYQYSGNCLSWIVVSNPATGTQSLTCAGAEVAVGDTEYTPSFAYSYQCSSSFVTSYAPTYVIMCIITGLVAPATRAASVGLRIVLTPTSCAYSWVLKFTPRILKGLPTAEDMLRLRANALYRPVFNANRLLTTQLTYLALLLTFGALFPPLAVCCAVAMGSVVLTARLEVGRYVSTAVAADRQDCLDEVESACAGVATPQQLRLALSAVLAVSCCFYTLFLFDTLGDEVGFAGAFWVLIVVPLLPIAALLAHLAARSLGWCQASVSAPAVDSHREVDVELSETQDSAASVNARHTPKEKIHNPLHHTKP